MSIKTPMRSAMRPADTSGLEASRQVLEDNADLVRIIERRTLIKGTLSLGALTMLTGCDVTDQDAVQAVLGRMSRWNDAVQAFLFSPTRLAPEFPASAVSHPPRWNGYAGREAFKAIDGSRWRVELAGLISDKRPRSLAEIKALPMVTMRTRHVCVEGWDYIGEWTGVPLKAFLESVGADTTARYVGFHCGDGYRGSIDMRTALHPQTQLNMAYAGQTIDKDFGFPIRLKAPTKLGYKQPKQIMAIEVTNTNPLGYWEERGFNWFGGI